MAFEKLTRSIDELKENIRAFQHSSIEYYKLSLYKKVVKGVISLITILLIGFFGIFALIFLSVAVAIAISNALDSPSAGYFIVAGFYLLLILLVATIGKKYIKKKVLTTSSKKIFND